MNKESLETYKSELEELTGKVFSGDLTPMVFDLVKESVFKTELIKELTGEDFIVERDDEPAELETVVEFDDWFSRFQRFD